MAILELTGDGVMLKVKTFKTSIYDQNQSLMTFLQKNLEHEELENKILAVTSKIVSLSENQVIAKDKISKKELIRNEAEYDLGEINYGCHLTIKHGQLIASAGIDESNSSNEDYILYPKDPFLSAKSLCSQIKSWKRIQNFGILITDSRTFPLRKGVIGTSLAHYGFSGIKSLIGEKDLFGRELKMTQVNIADALAVAAVLNMGEGNEQRPLALIEYSELQFNERETCFELFISIDEDLYSPLILPKIKKDLDD